MIKHKLSIAIVTAILMLTVASGQNIDDEAYWQPKWEEMASLGRGYVVWESNRTGRWRLFYRNLDGTGKRQLTPDEPNRDHYGPHISPDGTRVVYISYPHTRNAYSVLRRNEIAQLRIINIDGSNNRVLVPSARAYFENRSAVWVNDHELIYINGDGHTYQLNLRNGNHRRMTRSPHPEYGWLINSTMTHAVEGRLGARFSDYDLMTGTVKEWQSRGGCQPYFTQDGVWGFWTQGMGGPIKRVHLQSGVESDILRLNDPRMPRQRNYLYFPMISPCQRIFAVAASPNQHDHHNSDYAIFLFRMDPDSLEIIGEPVRYSFDRHTDRYPDVFLAKLELGSHQGKAPLTLTFTPETSSNWQWDFGDGTTRRGEQGRHTYTRPGSYTVTARSANNTIQGTVVVLPATPPRIQMPIITSGREIRVNFNEPVSIEDLRVRMDSGKTVESWQLTENKQQLIITLSDEIKEKDLCHLEGITDLAQRPNRMPAQRLTIEPPAWPVNQTGLLFVWENGNKPNLIADPETGEQRAFSLAPRGNAVLDHHYAMTLRGGAFVADDSFNRYLLDRLRTANQITIEATITPANAEQRGPARIVTFSTDTSSRNFTLGQEGDDLVVRLRTPQTGNNAHNPQPVLCRLTINEPNHVIVTYRQGRLVCYLNGEKVYDKGEIWGGFDNWSPHHFLIGSEYNNDREWAGSVEGIAIYNRFMEQEEAMSNALQYMSIIQGRKKVPRMRIEAELLARSDYPTLEQIAPYRDALVVYEYRVVENGDTLKAGDMIRVVHWALLAEQVMPAQRHEIGKKYRLTIEPLQDNPQIQGFFQSDTLPDDFDVELFYDLLPAK